MIFIFTDLILISNAAAENSLISKEKENMIIVDINGNGDFKKINDAIENAQTNSIIYIKNGEYKEVIDIDKKVYLIGEDMSRTIINPISEKNKYAIRLGAEGVKVVGLSIKNDAPGLYTSAVSIVSSSTIVVDCDIYETPIGIAIWTSNNLIKNCKIWGCKDEAIALLGTPYSKCNYNSIINCEFYKNCDGIELQYSSYNTIKNCEFYENTHTGIDAISSSNNYNIISGCEIYNNKVNGIYISSSSENKIMDCSIYDNGDQNTVICGNSNGNEFIKTSNVNIDENRLSSISRLTTILNKISNPLIQKIILIIESLSVFKEKYKF